jgi:hypothetical protein
MIYTAATPYLLSQHKSFSSASNAPDYILCTPGLAVKQYPYHRTCPTNIRLQTALVFLIVTMASEKCVTAACPTCLTLTLKLEIKRLNLSSPTRKTAHTSQALAELVVSQMVARCLTELVLRTQDFALEIKYISLVLMDPARALTSWQRSSLHSNVPLASRTARLPRTAR